MFTLINVRNMYAKFGKPKHLSSRYLICSITITNSTVKVLVEVSSNIVMATVSLICCVTEQSMAGLKVDTRGFKMSYLLPPSIKYTLNMVNTKSAFLSVYFIFQ